MPSAVLAGGNNGPLAVESVTNPESISGPLTVAGLITAQSGVSTQAIPAGYLGRSIDPDALSATAVVLTTAYGYLTRVTVPVSGVSTYLDVVLTTGNTVTGAVWALYTGTGVNPVAYTAESHTTVSGTANLYSIPWATPVNLAAGTYYVYQCVTGTTPSMPGVTATSTGSIGATVLNPNCSLSATVPTLNSAVLTSGAPTSVTGTTQLAWGTSWALAATKLWYGIR
jgi:stage V sporulation protein SpoVS